MKYPLVTAMGLVLFLLLSDQFTKKVSHKAPGISCTSLLSSSTNGTDDVKTKPDLHEKGLRAMMRVEKFCGYDAFCCIIEKQGTNFIFPNRLLLDTPYRPKVYWC